MLLFRSGRDRLHKTTVKWNDCNKWQMAFFVKPPHGPLSAQAGNESSPFMSKCRAFAGFLCEATPMAHFMRSHEMNPVLI
ncbi:MAG: hypothetical protein KJO63_10285 [Maribacter sp.]|nr:hypothetical protein [Maribacter sp.]